METTSNTLGATRNLPKLITEDLNVFYGDKQALKNVNLAINVNEVMALIGPSGCGKSTLLKALNRMLEVVPIARTTGSILMDGEDINDKRLDVTNLRRRFGVVAQKPDPFPFSIEHNIAYAPKLHGLIYSRDEVEALVESSLRRVHMWDCSSPTELVHRVF
jgi:phosphate transport system ATP-binding protein